MTIELILLGLAWFAAGVASFVFWWTRDYDLTTGNIPMAVFSGLPGPFSFFIGLLIHSGEGKVIMRRRGE